MSLIARVKSWLRVSSRRADFERQMQDEMQIHLEIYQADLRRRGVPDGKLAGERSPSSAVLPRASEGRLIQRQGLRPSDSPTGSLAGTPAPRAARQAHSLRSFALFVR